jgi:serine protease Do
MIGAQSRLALAAGLAAALLLAPPAGGDALAQAPGQTQPEAQAQGQTAAEARARLRDRLPSFADVAEDLLQSVVNISTSQRVTGSRGIPVPEVPEGSPFQEFFEDFFNRSQPGERTPRRVQSLGSGFVIDPEGYIVTNNHVIADADEINVNFSDGRRLLAEVVGTDSKTDLAILKVESDTPLPATRFGDSDELRIGDWVMAIGNPFGFGGTVTVGIVSALERDINSGPYDRFIQTDASINRGNSGGPLFNLDGEVIGVNTAIISPTGGSIGIGFAVPSDVAVPVIEQLKEFGETRRGWLGVRIQEVTDEIAESLGMDRAMGALVAGVTRDGPADAAGLEAGDVVVEFNGREVPSMRDLPRMVADTPVGESVDVVVLRRGERQTVQVELGRLEEGEEMMARLESGEEELDGIAPLGIQTLGLTLEALTEEGRSEYGIGDGIEGVLVTAVDPGSQAEEKGIQAGDVVLEVSQEPVATPEDVTARVEQLKTEGRRSALFLVASRDADMRFVAIRIDEGSE